MDASVKTNDNGEYTLLGMVPGKYYLKFTYGNGEQKIVDLKTHKETPVTSKDYKSTIVTDPAAKRALGGSTPNNSGNFWYQDLASTNASVAVDNLEQRKTVNDKNKENEDNGHPEKTENLKAETAKIELQVENTKGTNERQVTLNSSTESGQNNSQIETIGGLNFGIIKQPELRVRLVKKITKMRLTNAQGNTIFDGNPASEVIAGVSDLDNNVNDKTGSTYVRAELPEESIYGSTMQITYRLEVINESDINYYGENYYKFGDRTGAKEVTIEIKEVTDYLDSAMKCISGNTTSNGKTIEITTQKELDNSEIIKRINKIIIVGDWQRLYTNAIINRPESQKTSDFAELQAERILTTEDPDLQLLNSAQVTDAERKPEKVDETNPDANDLIRLVKATVDPGKRESATAVVIPPTGANKQKTIVYISVSIVILLSLAAGIVVIKKKI